MRSAQFRCRKTGHTRRFELKSATNARKTTVSIFLVRETGSPDGLLEPNFRCCKLDCYAITLDPNSLPPEGPERTPSPAGLAYAHNSFGGNDLRFLPSPLEGEGLGERGTFALKPNRCTASHRPLSPTLSLQGRGGQTSSRHKKLSPKVSCVHTLARREREQTPILFS